MLLGSSCTIVLSTGETKMSQSPAAHGPRMQTATHLSHAAQITCLSMVSIGVIISLLGLVV
jgi:hypothetical protein